MTLNEGTYGSCKQLKEKNYVHGITIEAAVINRKPNKGIWNGIWIQCTLKQCTIIDRIQWMFPNPLDTRYVGWQMCLCFIWTPNMPRFFNRLCFIVWNEWPHTIWKALYPTAKLLRKFSNFKKTARVEQLVNTNNSYFYLSLLNISSAYHSFSFMTFWSLYLRILSAVFN